MGNDDNNTTAELEKQNRELQERLATLERQQPGKGSPEDKVDGGDILMALIGLGIPFGIIALIKGQPKRAVTIIIISVVVGTLVVVSKLMSHPGGYGR